MGMYFKYTRIQLRFGCVLMTLISRVRASFDTSFETSPEMSPDAPMRRPLRPPHL